MRNKRALFIVIVISGQALAQAQESQETTKLDSLEKYFGRWSPALKEQWAGTDKETMLETTLELLKDRKNHRAEDYDALVDYGRASVYAYNYDVPHSWSEAEEALRTAAKLNPNRWEAYYYLGDLHVHSATEQRSGIDLLEKALACKEGKVNPKALLFLAEGYTLLGNPVGDSTETKMRYYALEKGKDSAIAKAMDYLKEYSDHSPYDPLVKSMSVALSNSYWGHHITSDVNGEEYKYNVARYSFTFSKEWLVRDENVDQAFVMFNIPNVEPDGSVNNNAVSIVYQDSVPFDAPRACLEHSRRKVIGTFLSIAPIADHTYGEHFRSQSDYGDIEGEMFYILGKHNDGYFIMFAATPASYSKNKSSVHELLRSFKTF
jgi:tetratricopeptide (TPR) repeat protein